MQQLSQWGGTLIISAARGSQQVIKLIFPVDMFFYSIFISSYLPQNDLIHSQMKMLMGQSTGRQKIQQPGIKSQ